MKSSPCSNSPPPYSGTRGAPRPAVHRVRSLLVALLIGGRGALHLGARLLLRGARDREVVLERRGHPLVVHVAQPPAEDGRPVSKLQRHVASSSARAVVR